MNYNDYQKKIHHEFTSYEKASRLKFERDGLQYTQVFYHLEFEEFLIKKLYDAVGKDMESGFIT